MATAKRATAPFGQTVIKPSRCDLCRLFLGIHRAQYDHQKAPNAVARVQEKSHYWRRGGNAASAVRESGARRSTCGNRNRTDRSSSQRVDEPVGVERANTGSPGIHLPASRAAR